jgi:hypothetical protein
MFGVIAVFQSGGHTTTFYGRTRGTLAAYRK